MEEKKTSLFLKNSKESKTSLSLSIGYTRWLSWQSAVLDREEEFYNGQNWQVRPKPGDQG